MFLASIENINKDEINYIYRDDNNNFIGLNINKDGIGNFDYESFNYFIKNFKYNDKCIKVSKYNDYDVYFNPVTNFNHYVKDGKEDFLMFYLKNGNDELLYWGDIFLDRGRDKVKSFFCGLIKYICCGVLCTIVIKLESSDIIDYKKYVNDNNISYASYIDYNNVSIDDYIDKIMYSGNLKEDEKKLLANEQLLTDITPYYSDKYSSKVINSKLYDINIEFFPAENKIGVEGYYNPLTPNTIHMSDKYKYPYDIVEIVEKRKNILVHEYIHMLQSNCVYNYLKEGTAPIIANEYYGIPIENNNKNINNTKLLIDIIGPEPILKSVFGNDSKELENIFADNLSLDEYKKIVNYLEKSPEYIDEDNDKEIKNILCTLYKNMYSIDIKEDNNVLFDLFYSGKYECSNNKIFLNKNKMQDIEEYDVHVKGKPEELCKKGLMKNDKRKTISRVISLERYNELIKNKEGSRCKYFFTSDDIERLEDCYLINGTDIVTFEQAVKLGYIKIQEVSSVGINEDIPKGWKYVYDINNYTFNNENIGYIYASNDSTCLRVTTKGIKSRFYVNQKIDKPFVKTQTI